eukprot:2646679-Pyramimonas_sp.AAC.1
MWGSRREFGAACGIRKLGDECSVQPARTPRAVRPMHDWFEDARRRARSRENWSPNREATSRRGPARTPV